MNPIRRAGIAAVLVLTAVSCWEQDEEPCSGCSSPHPYTETRGGPSQSSSGSVEVDYEDVAGVVTHECGSSRRNCIWSESRVEIIATVPAGWAGADAGGGAYADGSTDADADASTDADVDAAADAAADADADAEVDAPVDAEADAEVDAGSDGGAGAEADAPDAATGTPHGWGALGRVAIVDLGSTPLHESSPLVGARLIWCGNRQETLVTRSDGSVECASATVRDARIEALSGSLRVTGRTVGETTSSSIELEARTRSGLDVKFASTSSVAPYSSRVVEDCY
jgi:hypothetical protein